MPTIVSVDGRKVRPEDATISIFDRGFLYGDSVYEVLRVYDGIPFELDRHLQRLEGSGARIGMQLPVPPEHIGAELLDLLRAEAAGNYYVRIIVTRGNGPIGLDPALAAEPRRIVIIKGVEEVAPKAEVYSEGVEISLVSVRRNLKTALDPRAKTGNYLNSVMALAEARASGAYEAVMLDHHDLVTEGASSNIFIVTGGVILTPPLATGILEGVTRAVVLEVARGAGIRVLEVPFDAGAFWQADEALITSSIRELVPVVRVDGQVIGDGRPGPVTTRLRALFADYVRRYVDSRR